MKPGLLLGAAALLCAPAAKAADSADPICADRPGQTTPTCTVPEGMVQVETTVVGWAHHRSRAVENDGLVAFDSAVKFGISDRMHLELNVAPYVRSRTQEAGVRETVTGFGDMAIAAKYRLTSDEAPVQLAARPFVKLPTAKRSLGNGKVEGGIAFPVDWSIPGTPLSLTLGPELDLLADSDGSGHHAAMVQVMSIGVPVTSRLSLSGGALAAWDWDPAGTVRQYSLDGSAAYLLSKDVQLDAGVIVGLNRDTADVAVYSGIAFRF